jgi:thiol-disulfide isomerase/thioredoxin
MKLAIAAAAALLAIAFQQPPARPSASSAGRAAPSVTLKALDGSAVRLSDAKGKVVLIDFWATWCAPCQVTFPGLDALAASFRDQDVGVFAVNEDESRKNVEAFLEAHPHSMRVLLDPRMAAADAFKVRGIPSAFILDRDGRIRFSHLGYTAEAIDTFRREITSLLEPLQADANGR